MCDSDKKVLHKILKSTSLCHKTDAICCSILEVLVRDIFQWYILELPVQILHAQCTQKNDGREGV